MLALFAWIALLGLSFWWAVKGCRSGKCHCSACERQRLLDAMLKYYVEKGQK